MIVGDEVVSVHTGTVFKITKIHVSLEKRNLITIESIEVGTLVLTWDEDVLRERYKIKLKKIKEENQGVINYRGIYEY